MAPVIIPRSQTFTLPYVLPNCQQDIKYLKARTFIPHSMGDVHKYGLNTLGCSSVIRYMGDDWKFMWFETGSDITVYVNRNGDFLRFNSRHDIDDMDIIRLDITDMEPHMPPDYDSDFNPSTPPQMTDSGDCPGAPSPKKVCIERDEYIDFNTTPCHMTDSSTCPDAPMAKRVCVIGANSTDIDNSDEFIKEIFEYYNTDMYNYPYVFTNIVTN